MTAHRFLNANTPEGVRFVAFATGKAYILTATLSTRKAAGQHLTEVDFTLKTTTFNCSQRQDIIGLKKKFNSLLQKRELNGDINNGAGLNGKKIYLDVFVLKKSVALWRHKKPTDNASRFFVNSFRLSSA
ncbi:MAG: hypothetical protein ACYCV8_09375 [bacterium]